MLSHVARSLLRTTASRLPLPGVDSAVHVLGANHSLRNVVISFKRTMAAEPFKSFSDPEVSKFLDDAYKLIKEDVLQKGTDGSVPVLQFQHPQELMDLLPLDISSGPVSHDTLLDGMKSIIKYSVKTGHPHFYNQLFGGLDPYSQAGSWLSESLNSNIHTFEVSPVFIVMEKYLFKKMCDIIGFENGDGIFCPGGSASNVMALQVARYKKFPQVKTEGIYGLPKLRCYISEDGHYSLKKAAGYLGLGSDNVVPVKTDEQGRILTDDLEQKIQEDLQKGYAPLFLMATSGSTVLGSFDDLTALSKVCRQHGIWLHADACWGGGTLLSKKHRHLMDGVHLCDSVAWNFHKIYGTPVQCSALLINDQKILLDANSSKAEYLFQPDKCYDVSYDVGDKTVQCGRKVDVVKLWLQWKAFGDSGFEARVDRAFDNVRYLQEKVKTTEGFRLIMPEFQFVNACFWYIPPRLRGQEETKEWWAEVGKVAPKVKERMVKAGTMMINYQPLSSKGLVNFFRLIVHNPSNTYKDMDFIISEIDRLGWDL
ncbi:cysteine sulfinic acid decarboxylase [Aplysia californica]|uniref:Cysteine sulfinic acid decarboxylase n=1 Tax=Aplysia californica TaxID=6500 RepID=A0ABM0JHX9_APLCA|nr:cysteine sulfinic acid decarboxylase [Aplysia californica]XP_005094034.1 cysteine sulfinic acid decarboxylase [Aplysia californica]XP_005094038.1 cysteine sulfinic acid decarboxylase [Aplysia californica]XP_005094039.1 cysteine sulfinic acid decarboxylase [Aplysia californica]XP_005094041.1 cysteine sulfinic acid decarboxylase [Aplysia californica]XP_005094045.1 cysteine sulfinic acid decarboxylase [Aplysia californica]XP_012935522.1 cysteine sulfinic acid decarboxylase [Aplysia californic